MAHVHFTKNLRRFYPDLADGPFEGATASELLATIDARWPGLAAYVVDERGTLRKHVNVFVDGIMVADRQGLSDPVQPGSEVHIIQALSGG
jgi:molybdopterin synthase sulfur carrier subunit